MPSLGLDPAVFPCFMMIEVGKVGLDVQKRCPVEDVYIPDDENVFPDFDQFHDGKTDGVRPDGGAGGENSPGFRIQEGHYEGFPSFRSVE